MPNTLAHVGAQSLISRGVVRGADLKWIYLGLLIPDLPWIGLRVFKSLPLGPLAYEGYFYDGLAYAHIQASLSFSLLLAGFFAAFSTRPRLAFVLLALNVVLHLLLDALQTKWANGVHLLAPFDWHLTNFGFFWPESAVSLGLTLLGLIYILVAWRASGDSVIDLCWPKGWRLWGAVFLLLAYIFAPLVLLEGPKAADNHSIHSLTNLASRAGRPVAFDRSRIDDRAGQVTLLAPDGEALDLVGADLPATGLASVRGHFLDGKKIEVAAYHQHWGVARDYPTMLGLVLIAIIWLKAIWRRHGGRFDEARS